MGEATHGQAKIIQFRIKVFKKLVKKCGYTVFVLEENYSCCELVNKYIQKGIGHPDDLLLYFMWPWKNYYILNLIKWMREYNKTHKNKLEFKGVDCQVICNDYKSNSKINKFVTNIVKSKKKNRDKSMFDIFMKIYNPNKKYFIYGHMGHLQKEKYYNQLWFGCYLHKKFKENYYAIGNAFYYGSYLGVDEDNDYKFSTITITKNMTKNSRKFKDGINISNKVKEYANKNIFEGGAVFSSKTPMITFDKTIVNNRFDAIMVINDEHPFRMIKY
jgi:erythromycin esterase-like protein